MWKNIFLGGLVLWVLAIVPCAFAGKVELTTYYPAPYGEYRNLNSTEDSNFATTSGKVGVRTDEPAAALDVRGQIRSASLNGTVYQTTSRSIDWDNGNIMISTLAAAGWFEFSNMQEGGAYTLITKNTNAAQNTFSQSGLTFKFMPANGPTTASTTTVYTFIRAQNIVYVSWISGY